MKTIVLVYVGLSLALQGLSAYLIVEASRSLKPPVYYCQIDDHGGVLCQTFAQWYAARKGVVGQ